MHIHSKDNLPPEQDRTVFVINDCRSKTRTAHPLKQEKPQTIYDTRSVHIKYQANLPPERRRVTVSVTIRVYIKNQANSPTEARWAQPVLVTIIVHIKN